MTIPEPDRVLRLRRALPVARREVFAAFERPERLAERRGLAGFTELEWGQEFADGAMAARDGAAV